MSKTCSIYKILNKINGKYYIGSSSDFSKRKRAHLSGLRNGTHHNIILQRAYDKYGENNLEFEIICHCEERIKLILEQEYINAMKPAYNISISAFAPMTGRKHSNETKLKFKKRKILRGEEHPNYGKSWSPNQRKLLMSSRRNQTKSEQERKEMSKRAKDNNYFKYIEPYIKKKRRSVIDNNGVEYESLTQAAKITGVSKQSICNILKGRRSVIKGYSFRYKEENENK